MADLGWVFWMIILIIVIGFIYLFFGGKDDINDIEIIGLKPIAVPGKIDWSRKVAEDVECIQTLRPLPPVPGPVSSGVEDTTFSTDVLEYESPPDSPGRHFGSIGEEMCVRAMESYLGRRVQNGIRPAHLKNPKTGRCLEYDCYDPKLKVAVEYNGRQHYEYVPRFHKDMDAFYDQVFRDKIKLEKSKENDIILITIPYTIDTYVKKGDKSVYTKSTREERYNRIKAYLYPILESIQPPCST